MEHLCPLSSPPSLLPLPLTPLPRQTVAWTEANNTPQRVCGDWAISQFKVGCGNEFWLDGRPYKMQDCGGQLQVLDVYSKQVRNCNWDPGPLWKSCGFQKHYDCDWFPW
ncbi:hypothetical protein GE09DRAFT_1052329 [Coniochaeta sp. 2T2.1]|nr:hypothetical protein GE09DRAFT_1052329 [Coniochaeta sp. 2T2.1]